MPSYLYGLVLSADSGRVPGHVVGIEGEAVRVVRARLLAGLVGTVEQSPVPPTLDNVKAHDAVLQATVDVGVAVAAARFRQTFDDDGDVRRHLDEYGERVARMLGELDGCVEMRLLLRDADVIAPAAPAAPAHASATSAGRGPGHDYLEHLRAERARVTHLALAPMLGAVVRAERVSLLNENRGAVFAHAVERGRVEEYRQTIRAFPALADATVVGPLAFYSFAEPDV